MITSNHSLKRDEGETSSKCTSKKINVMIPFISFLREHYNQNNEIVIPIISFCKPTLKMLRNSSQRIQGLSPAQLYNETFSFSDISIRMWFYIKS